MSVFRVGFLEILEEDRRRKGERRARRRLHSIREPDDFIAAEFEGRQTLRRTRNTSGKSLKGFTNSRSMEILMWWTYLLLLSTNSLASSLKMSASKMAASTSQEVFQAFKKVYSSYLRLAHSSPFSASLPQETPLSRFSSEAMPHPSVFARVNKHPLNFQLSLQQLPWERRKTPKIRY